MKSFVTLIVTLAIVSSASSVSAGSRNRTVGDFADQFDAYVQRLIETSQARLAVIDRIEDPEVAAKVRATLPDTTDCREGIQELFNKAVRRLRPTEGQTPAEAYQLLNGIRIHFLASECVALPIPI